MPADITPIIVLEALLSSVFYRMEGIKRASMKKKFSIYSSSKGWRGRDGQNKKFNSEIIKHELTLIIQTLTNWTDIKCSIHEIVAYISFFFGYSFVKRQYAFIFHSYTEKILFIYKADRSEINYRSIVVWALLWWRASLWSVYLVCCVRKGDRFFTTIYCVFGIWSSHTVSNVDH